MEHMRKKKIPKYDPQTGELNPYYEQLTGKKNPMAIKPIKILVDDYKSTSPKEIWIDGVLYNFIYGFLGAMIIVSITIKIDIAILFAYLIYYFFVGKVINRPKYVTSLGKFIVFPIPTALGAFIGYKITPMIIQFLT
jgi:hypothetical protein